MNADPANPQPFTSDAPLFYNVGIWGERGYAVPNFGKQAFTVNETIEEATTEGGKRLSIIMHHEDTGRTDPPSVNTVVRMIEFMNRTRVILLGRAIDENEPKFESAKVKSPRMPMRVFPCPYFNVRNRLMRRFAGTAFSTLAELMQSSEVAITYDITKKLAEKAVRYVQRFQKMLGMEYFGMDELAASDPKLNLMEHLDKYTPTLYGFVSGEVFDSPATLSWPQEYDLGPLAEGLLVCDLPALGPYPWPDSVNDANAGQVVTTGANASTSASAAAGSQAIPPFPANTTFRL